MKATAKNWIVSYATRTPDGTVTEFDGISGDPEPLYITAPNMLTAYIKAMGILSQTIERDTEVIVYDIGMADDCPLFDGEEETAE